MSESNDILEIERMSIDQFAGSVVLILGAIGSLLLVIWQSRCACRCRIGCSDKCYIFDCQRSPPPTKEDVEQPKNKENVEEIEEKEQRNGSVANEETPSLTPNSMGRKN